MRALGSRSPLLCLGACCSDRGTSGIKQRSELCRRIGPRCVRHVAIELERGDCLRDLTAPEAPCELEQTCSEPIDEAPDIDRRYS